MATGDLLDLAEHAMRSAQMADTSGTAYAAGDLVQAKAKVNEVCMSIGVSGDPWDFLEQEGQWTTTAGSDVYTYASIATAISLTSATIREIQTMTIDLPAASGSLLASMDWTSLESMTASTQDAESTGTPCFWSKWASRIRLSPSPDAVYTIGAFCSVTPSEMTSSTDVPLIPAAWRHRVIVPYAAALLLEQEGGSEAGAQYERLMRRYEDSFTKMRTAHATAKRPTFNVIQPGFMEREMAGGDW